MTLIKFKAVISSQTHAPTGETAFIIDGIKGDIFKRETKNGKLTWWLNQQEIKGLGTKDTVGYLEEEFQEVLQMHMKAIISLKGVTR